MYFLGRSRFKSRLGGLAPDVKQFAGFLQRPLQTTDFQLMEKVSDGFGCFIVLGSACLS